MVSLVFGPKVCVSTYSPKIGGPPKVIYTKYFKQFKWNSYFLIYDYLNILAQSQILCNSL